MQWLEPQWFVGLALGLLVLYWHLRRRNPKWRTVSSLTIWKTLANQSNPLKRRRPPVLSVLLLLQLLTLAALVAALSKPYWGAKPPEGVVFVLDASLDMNQRVGNQTVFQAAQNHITRQLELMGESSQVTLLLAQAKPLLLAVDWQHPRDLLSRLRQATATHTLANWPAVRQMLQSLPLQQTQVVLLTNDPLARGWLEGLGPLQVIWLGQPTPNRRFASIQLLPPEGPRPFWRIEGRIEGLQQASKMPLETYLLTPDGPAKRLDAQELDFSQSATLDFRVNLLLPEGGLVELRLPDDDANWADNRHWLHIQSPLPKTRVLLVGPPSPLWEQGLNSQSNLELRQSPLLPADADLYDLVVIQGLATAKHPQTSVLWVPPAGPRLEIPPLTDAYPSAWLSDHPLSASLLWGDLRISQAWQVPLLTGAEALVQAGNHPLVQARTTTWGREVWLGFDPAFSNWAKGPGFAVFLANLLQWVKPSTAGCQAGAACELEIKTYLEGVNVLEPSGAQWTLKAPSLALDDPNGPSRYLPSHLEDGFVPNTAGIYWLQSSALRWPVAVNVPLVSGTTKIQASQPPSPWGPQGLWPWVLGLALALLVLEATLSGLRQQGYWLHLRGQAARKGRWIAAWQIMSVIALVLALFNPNAWLPERVSISVAILEDPDLHTAQSRPILQGFGQQLTQQGFRLLTLGPKKGQSPSLDSALEQAMAQQPLPLEVVLIGRGSHTTPMGPSLARAVQQKHRINALPFGQLLPQEVWVEPLQTPTQLYARQPFWLETVVFSRSSQTMEMLLLRQNQTHTRQTVRLQAGSNRVQIRLQENAPGNYRYSLEAVSYTDIAANNRQEALLRVGETPRVGLLGESTAAQTLQKALRTQGLDVNIISPTSLNTPENLSPWSSLVLYNLPASSLSSNQQANLESWVKAGGGLAILGGNQSFGPGGYFQTTLEQLSPLSAKVPSEAPKVAMLFILDKSGSMNQPTGTTRRIDIAKSATAAAVRLLHPASMAGVVAFDTEATVWIPLNSLNFNAFENRLATLEPGGGTALRPALELALEQLSSVDALSRHAVLLSDGLSEVGDFEALARSFATANISLSTVAVGDGSDVQLVEKLARWGGGQSYVTADWQSLPGILAQETLLRSTTPIKQETVQPQRVAPTTLLEDWPPALPPLGGYVHTTPKAQADLLLSTGKHPLLAHWRYGSGQVVAFASEAAGSWGTAWANTPEYPAMWAGLLRRIAKSPNAPTLVRWRDELRLLDSPSPALLQIPQHPAQLTRLYPASIPIAASGLYRQDENALWVSHSELFNFSLPSVVPALAEATGGQTISELPTATYKWRWAPVAAWPLWVVLGLMAFMLSLGLRYR